MATVLRLAGNTFTINSTANVVPCNASQVGNASSGATFLYIINTNAATANVTVANSTGNIGTVQILANTFITLSKYESDTVVATPNVVCTPVAEYF